MRSWMSIFVVTIATATPVLAEDKPVVSLGYSVATYLDGEGGAAPFGVYLTLGSPGSLGVEFDMAYHRDTIDFGRDQYTLHTTTVMVGPRFAQTSGDSRAFGRALIGGRYDMIESVDNQAWGGMVGGGVDVGLSETTFFRFGADFELFLDEGEQLKVLRLNLGLCFQ